MALYRFTTLPSTQDELKRILETQGARHLDAVITEVQTGGRGRLGRDWVSTPRSLSASIYLQDFRLPMTWIPHWLGVSVLKALMAMGLGPSRVRLKWPNDLVLQDESKAGGILCEKIEPGVIAGIGLNLTRNPDGLGRDTANLGLGVSPVILLEQIIAFLEKEPGIEELRKEYEALSLYAVGDELCWMDPATGAHCEGRFVSLGTHGELLVSRKIAGSIAEFEVRALFSEEVSRVKKKSPIPSSER